jgi:hypothetical protein
VKQQHAGKIYRARKQQRATGDLGPPSERQEGWKEEEENNKKCLYGLAKFSSFSFVKKKRSQENSEESF